MKYFVIKKSKVFERILGWFCKEYSCLYLLEILKIYKIKLMVVDLFLIYVIYMYCYNLL